MGASRKTQISCNVSWKQICFKCNFNGVFARFACERNFAAVYWMWGLWIYWMERIQMIQDFRTILNYPLLPQIHPCQDANSNLFCNVTMSSTIPPDDPWHNWRSPLKFSHELLQFKVTSLALRLDLGSWLQATMLMTCNQAMPCNYESITNAS